MSLPQLMYFVLRYRKQLQRPHDRLSTTAMTLPNYDAATRRLNIWCVLAVFTSIPSIAVIAADAPPTVQGTKCISLPDVAIPHRGIFYANPDVEEHEKQFKTNQKGAGEAGRQMPPTSAPADREHSSIENIVYDSDSGNANTFWTERSKRTNPIELETIGSVIFQMTFTNDDDESGIFDSIPIVTGSDTQVDISLRVKGEAELYVSEFRKDGSIIGSHYNDPYFALKFEQIGYQFTTTNETVSIIASIRVTSGDTCIKNVRITTFVPVRASITEFND